MPPLRFASLWRAWIEIEGTPSLLVNTIANPKSIRVGQSTIRMELRQCPELGAIMQGMKFATQEGTQYVGSFECHLNSTSGTLKAIAGGRSCTIDENDIETAEFSAYYLPDPEKTNAVTLTVLRGGKVSGADEVAIAPGGRITASSNLIGKTIKMRVVYPQIIVQTDEAIDTVNAHVVGLWEDGTIKYAGVTGCRMNSNGREVNLRYDVANAEVATLI